MFRHMAQSHVRASPRTLNLLSLILAKANIQIFGKVVVGRKYENGEKGNMSSSFTKEIKFEVTEECSKEQCRNTKEE